MFLYIATTLAVNTQKLARLKNGSKRRGYTRYGTVTLVRGNHTHTRKSTLTPRQSHLHTQNMIGTHSASVAQLLWATKRCKRYKNT